MIQAKCGYDVFLLLLMIYPAVPGFVGMLGSAIQAIAVFIRLLVHKDKSASIGTHTQYWLIIAALANFLPFAFYLLSLLVPVYTGDECANANLLFSRATASYSATPFIMALFLVFTTFNLHKHVQQVVTASSQQHIHLQLKSRRALGFSIFALILNAIAHLLIVACSTQTFGAQWSTLTFALMIFGQVLQIATGIGMLVCAITIHRVVAQTRQVLMSGAIGNAESSGSASSVYTTVAAADLIMLEVRATAAVNLTNAIYLLLANGVVPIVSLFTVPIGFNVYGAVLGILFAYPAMPLVQSIATLVMIIMFYVMSADSTDKKNVEIQQKAAVNEVQPVAY